MRIQLVCCLLAGAAAANWVKPALAQHSDILFSYDSNQVTLATENAAVEGVWTGNLPVGGPANQGTTSPGFAATTDAVLYEGVAHAIGYDVLDGLHYWDGAGFSSAGPGVHLELDNGLGPNTLAYEDSGELLGAVDTPYANVIDEVSSTTRFHKHIAFRLRPNSPTPPYGAYGLKLRLITGAQGVAPSDPFMLVFNFGLGQQAFADSLDAFAALLSPELPGDFNGDGRVDSLDYAVWREGVGEGQYTTDQFSLWLKNYGATAPTANPTPAPAPEPAAVGLLVTALLGVCCGGRRPEYGGRPPKQT